MSCEDHAICTVPVLRAINEVSVGLIHVCCTDCYSNMLITHKEQIKSGSLHYADCICTFP